MPPVVLKKREMSERLRRAVSNPGAQQQQLRTKRHRRFNDGETALFDKKINAAHQVSLAARQTKATPQMRKAKRRPRHFAFCLQRTAFLTHRLPVGATESLQLFQYDPNL